MSNFWRSLFGSKKAGNDRKVIGLPKTIPFNELPHIQESKRRLTALQQLCSQYNSTPHARQIEQVYQKTRRIHAYLTDRGRGHELELFHLQHTDHVRVLHELPVGLLLQCRSPVADAFGRSRLGRDHGLAMGTLPVDAGFDAIIARTGAGILPAEAGG